MPMIVGAWSMAVVLWQQYDLIFKIIIIIIIITIIRSILLLLIFYYYYKNEKHLKNEQRNRDALPKKELIQVE